MPYTMYEVWEHCYSGGCDIYRKVASGLSKEGAEDLARQMSPHRLSNYDFFAAVAGFDPSEPLSSDEF